jgi:uncharacterized OB-fold protein
MEGMRPVVVISPPADVEYDEVTRPFWESLREGVLSLQKCADCDAFRMPPSSYCPECRSTNAQWPQLSGRGNLYTYTIIPLNPRDSDSPSYVAALVCPPEAPDTKVFCNIVDCTADELKIGMELKFIRSEPGRDMALFRPVSGSGAKGEG